MTNKAWYIQVAEEGHNNAWKQAEKKLPALSINQILEIILGVYQAENPKLAAQEAAMKLAERFQKPVKAYVDAFAVECIQGILKNSPNEDIAKELGNKAFAKTAKKACQNVVKAVCDFAEGNINEIELIQRFNNSGIIPIAQEII